jgi:hypothetical protein
VIRVVCDDERTMAQVQSPRGTKAPRPAPAAPASELTPLQYMLAGARDESQPMERRQRLAKMAAPYMQLDAASALLKLLGM